MERTFAISKKDAATVCIALGMRGRDYCYKFFADLYLWSATIANEQTHKDFTLTKEEAYQLSRDLDSCLNWYKSDLFKQLQEWFRELEQ